MLFFICVGFENTYNGSRDAHASAIILREQQVEGDKDAN